MRAHRVVHVKRKYEIILEGSEEIQDVNQFWYVR